MNKIFILMLVLLMVCPVMAVAQSDDPLPLGAQFTGKKFDAEKMKQRMRNNKNFGSFNQIKPRKSRYSDNLNGMATGSTKKQYRQKHMNPNWGKMPASKYGDVKIMQPPKGLRNIGCFGTADLGKC